MFANRRDAGRRLATELLRETADRVANTGLVVVGMARGGVPVAAEVAARLAAALDVIVVRKIGYPRQTELGVGAIAEGGVRILNQQLIDQVGMRTAEVDAVTERELAELVRRVTRYRAGRPPVPVEGSNVILVDDGLATGYTARAAIASLRSRGAASVRLAVPVASEETVRELRTVADGVAVLEMPARFRGVGSSYGDFRQTSDEEVVALLAQTGA